MGETQKIGKLCFCAIYGHNCMILQVVADFCRGSAPPPRDIYCCDLDPTLLDCD